VHPAVSVILLDQSELGDDRVEVLLHGAPTDLLGNERGRR
jgi:hypothetical protein